MKILFLFLTFVLAADIFFFWYVKVYSISLGSFHIYYLIEFVLIMSIMYIWQDSNRRKVLFLKLMVVYSAFWAIAMFTFEPLTGLYTFKACISQTLLTICAEYTLFFIIKNRTESILTDYRFWVLLGFVIYYAGTLIVIASRGILLHYPIEILLIVSTIDWSLKILFNILFAIGFLCSKTKSKNNIIKG